MSDNVPRIYCDPQTTSTVVCPPVASLPDAAALEYDFKESSFFAVHGRSLPDPTLIKLSNTRQIITFSHLNLIVKQGPEASVGEAITTHIIGKLFAGKVKVPEIFGWRVRDGHVLIYMELIEGDTLEDRWESLTRDDKENICKQLADMVGTLRTLVPSPEHSQRISTLVNGPLLDRIFEDRPKAGPFGSLADFYSWMEWLPQRFLAPSQRYTDPYIPYLPPDSPIVFTHADIHPSNIMLCKSSRPRVVALIDWGQSGWLPDYWEYCKMCYTTDYNGEWRKDWIPRIVRPREDESEVMAFYGNQIGAT